MKKSNNAVTFAGIALALDILLFIIASLAVLSSTNIWFILALGILIYVLAYDATKATIFIMNHFKK